MIGYVSLGTSDLDRAAAFYDALLGEIGAKRMMQSDRFVVWFVAPDRPALGVFKVDALHRKALELGATDEGAAGPRGIPGFYAGYFRDLDGNKLNFYCFTK